MKPNWRVELLGRLCGRWDGVDISRFRTRKVGLLLAYLAYHADRPQPRDVLAEQVWPEEGLDAARNNLRVSLSALRRQFIVEAPYVEVVVADRSSVRLNTEVCRVDVAEFEAALAGAEEGVSEAQGIEGLVSAIHLYRGN